MGSESIKGTLICLTRYDEGADKQYNYFVSLTTSWHGKIKLHVINRSIVESQVNVRSSMLGGSGTGKEVQREFLTLMKGRDIYKSTANGLYLGVTCNSVV